MSSSVKNVDYMLYSLSNKLNKPVSASHQGIHLEDAIVILNEAQRRLVDRKYSSIGSSPYGFDSVSKRYEDLQVLVVEDFKIDKLNKEAKNVYSFSVPDDYRYYIRGHLLSNKGECENKRINIYLFLAKHADVNVLLTNEHYKPSFEYEETFCLISDNKVRVYTDGEFTVEKFFLTYLRNPKEIDKEGYIKLDGSPSVNSDCELPFVDEIIDEACVLYSMYTENKYGIETGVLRIQNQGQ